MIPDRDERQRAVMTDGHAFVWASAGTGKTHTLALRALYLLLTAPFQARAAGTECARLYSAATRADRLRSARAVIRRLVLTTFTRKAAAEMQTRLYEYLDRLASSTSAAALEAEVSGLNNGRGDEQFVEIVTEAARRAGGFDRLRDGAEALGELAIELQVCTLHSFAAAMLRRHPLEAGIPPTAQFTEEDAVTAPDVSALLVERWWQYATADPELDADLRALLEVAPLDDLSGWLTRIFQQPWLVEELDLGRPDPRALTELVAAGRALVAGLQAAQKNWGKIITARQSLAAALDAIDAKQRGVWTGLCRVLQSLEGVVFDSDSSFVKTAVAALGAREIYFREFTAAYRPALQQCLAEEQLEPWRRWRRFAARFAEWADGAAVRELGVVTFDDMVRLAARLLERDDAVRREERERLWAVLVDEFQDTDPVQLGLLTSLLERHGPDDHVVLGFFVGDQKQSIYRFRGADLPAIDSFVRRAAEIVKTAEIGQFRLTTSFRSLPPITKLVNHLFAEVVPLPEYAGQELAPARDERKEPLVPEWRVLGVADAEAGARTGRDLAARETARLIREYLEEPGAGAKSYNDVVVLVRSHEELNALLPALESAGIPVVSSGAKTFYRQPEVLDALNLLIALQHPQDRLAVGAVLRSPLVGLTDPEIFALLEAIRPEELFHGAARWPGGLPEPARRRLEALRGLVTGRDALTLAEWMRQVRQFIPVGAYARRDVEGRVMARLDSVLAAFGHVVELGRLAPLAWLLEQRARADRSDAWDADLGEDVSVTDESVAAVRAMTIHKAKGLQGKYVIVYGWQTTLDKCRPSNRGRREPLCLTGRDGRVVRGFRLPWGDLEIISNGWDAAEALNREYDAEEGKRLAYVAATRACDRLVLLSPHRRELERGVLSSMETSVLAALVEGREKSVPLFDGKLRVALFGEGPSVETARVRPVTIADARAYQALWRGRIESLEAPPVPLLHKPSQPESPEETDAVEPTDYAPAGAEPAREIGMAAGTLVHAYLERHLLSPAFERDQLEALLALLRDDRLAGPASERAAAVLDRFYRGELVDAAGVPFVERVRRGRVLGRELPVYLTDTGKSWAGVIDLVLEESGIVTAVDYKISKAQAPLPATYVQQQRLYTEALRRLLPGKKVRFEFWWLGGSVG